MHKKSKILCILIEQYSTYNIILLWHILNANTSNELNSPSVLTLSYCWVKATRYFSIILIYPTTHKDIIMQNSGPGLDKLCFKNAKSVKWGWQIHKRYKKHTRGKQAPSHVNSFTYSGMSQCPEKHRRINSFTTRSETSAATPEGYKGSSVSQVTVYCCTTPLAPKSVFICL